MKVWSGATTAAAKGKTAGTFDAIGTVTLKSNAAHLLGFIFAAIPAIPTDGENAGPIIKVDSKDLGISQEEFAVALVAGDGIATNDKEVPVFAEFIPFKLADPNRKLGNANIDFTISGVVTSTGGFDVVVSAVYADGIPDQIFFNELQSGICAPAIGGDVTSDAGTIKTTAATTFATGLAVTSMANELIGILGYVITNAPTAGEGAVGFTEFQASQVEDFSPQQWPFMINWSASIGTPVGQANLISRRGGFYWPVRFPAPGVNFTIAVSQSLAVALTNEADGVAAIKWR